MDKMQGFAALLQKHTKKKVYRLLPRFRLKRGVCGMMTSFHTSGRTWRFAPTDVRSCCSRDPVKKLWFSKVIQSYPPTGYWYTQVTKK